MIVWFPVGFLGDILHTCGRLQGAALHANTKIAFGLKSAAACYMPSMAADLKVEVVEPVVLVHLQCLVNEQKVAM